MAESEAIDITTGVHGDVMGVTYYVTALYCALLMNGPADYTRKLAAGAKRHKTGWSGMLGFYGYLIVMSFYVIASGEDDPDMLKEAYNALDAFPTSESLCRSRGSQSDS
jgi:hypothetical protein